MSLTPAERKKMLKIEQELADKRQALDDMKSKAAHSIAKLALEYNLYMLEKVDLRAAFKTISEQHKLL